MLQVVIRPNQKEELKKIKRDNLLCQKKKKKKIQGKQTILLQKIQGRQLTL
jgi:hypothetical protein